MLWLLLVACGGEIGGQGGTNEPVLDVDVTPRAFAKSYAPGMLDCTYEEDPQAIESRLMDELGTVHVESYEATGMLVQVTATSTTLDVEEDNSNDPSPDPAWIDASFRAASEPFSETHGRADFTVLALGRCDEGQSIPRGDHFFDLEVLVGSYSYPIEAVITLE